MGLLVCLELRLSTMKPTWPLHSPSVTFLSHGFVNKCILRDTGELLETMGTTPARSCPEGRGKRARVEKGREGRTMEKERMAGEGSPRGGASAPRRHYSCLHLAWRLGLTQTFTQRHHRGWWGKCHILRGKVGKGHDQTARKRNTNTNGLGKWAKCSTVFIIQYAQH